MKNISVEVITVQRGSGRRTSRVEPVRLFSVWSNADTSTSTLTFAKKKCLAVNQTPDVNQFQKTWGKEPEPKRFKKLLGNWVRRGTCSGSWRITADFCTGKINPKIHPNICMRSLWINRQAGLFIWDSRSCLFFFFFFHIYHQDLPTVLHPNREQHSTNIWSVVEIILNPQIVQNGIK